MLVSVMCSHSGGWCFAVLEQIVVSLGSGPWDQLFGGGNSPAIAVAGFSAFISGLVAILAIPRSRSDKSRGRHWGNLLHENFPFSLLFWHEVWYIKFGVNGFCSFDFAVPIHYVFLWLFCFPMYNQSFKLVKGLVQSPLLVIDVAVETWIWIKLYSMLPRKACVNL